jgi:hypothetical protein
MGLLTVEGVYHDGKVELQETPPEVPRRARVLVTFLPAAGGEEAIDELTAQETARREAAGRLLARLNEGINFGGPPYPRREELYERASRYGEGDG